MEMVIVDHTADYQVKVRGHDAVLSTDTEGFWKTFEAKVFVGSQTIIAFTGKVMFTVGQLEQIAADLRTLERRSAGVTGEAVHDV